MRVYCLFETAWGWFGLLGEGEALMRSVLPMPTVEDVKSALLAGQDRAQEVPRAFLAYQQKVKEYYRGKPIDFSDIQVNLSGFSCFYRSILEALRRVSYGQTISYSQLAAQGGYPAAIRAAATAVAANPLPLIIPCHRVIRKDGQLGGFSAAGGAAVKEKMLRWEKAI